MKSIKKITATAMAAILALGAFTVTAGATETEDKTVTVSVEAFTVGCGYIVEPTTISFNNGDTAATAVQKVLEQNNIPYDATYEYGFYLQGITFEHSADIPSYITNAVVAHDDEYDEDILFGDYIDEDYTPNDLAASDHTPLSGWMFTVNQPTAESLSLSMSQALINNGDVIRVQFSLDCGADIGVANLSGMPQWGFHSDFYEVADRTELTKAVADSEASAPSPLYNAVQNMKNMAANLPATQAEIDSSVSDYNTVASLNPLSGDVDKNGTISTIDAILTQKSVLTMVELDSIERLIADYNSDGTVNLSDAISIQKKSIGL